MAYTKCGACGNHRFELSEVEPSGGRFKYFFIQCSSCGVPVTAVEYDYVGALLDELKGRIDNIESNQGAINQNIQRLAARLR